MAGARIGYAIASQSNVQTFRKIRLHYGVNRNAQIGALASLADEAFRERVVREVRAMRAKTTTRSRGAAACGYIRSRTNFVCIDAGSAQRATRVMQRAAQARRVDSQARRSAARPLRPRERRHGADARAPSRTRCARSSRARCRRERAVTAIAAIPTFTATSSRSQRAFALIEPDDVVLCLGDIVGYGPNPNECVQMIRERAKHAVLGNHDLAALDNFGVEYFNDAGARGDRVDAKRADAGEPRVAQRAAVRTCGFPSFCWCTARR